MLLLMRKRIGSIVVKAFAFLLILGFGAWGIQDMLGYQVGGGGAVAEVGSQKLGPQTFYSEVNRELSRMRQLFGNRLSIEDARKFGLVERVLERQIGEMATLESAQDLGIAISDGLVLRAIQAEPMFAGLAGNFDRQRFELLLSQNGLSEGEYVARVRADLASQQLLGNVAAGATAPKAWVTAISRYREEKRQVESVFVADASAGALAEPTDTQLRAYYDANKQTYTAPEYRAVTYVNLDAEDLAKEIEVSDEELRTAYEHRADEFTKSEKRKVRQMLIGDEAKAKSAHQRLVEGADFVMVAKEVAGQDEAAVDLGEVTKSDLLPELADTVFTIADGAVTEPVKTALGWHIFQVTGITPGGTMSFEEAKPQVLTDTQREKAIDGLYELSNTFEDALGGGATLEEAARQLNLTAVQIPAIDAEGKDRDGKAIEDLPGGANFAATAFATEENADSALTEAGEQGFYIIRVDKVTKPALRPFEEVAAKVKDAWSAEQRRIQAEARAKAIADAANTGKPLAEAVGVQALEVKASNPLTRDGRGGGADFNAELIVDIFDLEVGKAAYARVGDGYRVAVLKTITQADPAADKKGVEELADVLARSLQGDVADQLRTAFRKEAGVTVYRAAIDRLFGSADGQTN
jgi:peptidyl-prolyl cis-trans isomerase D